MIRQYLLLLLSLLIIGSLSCGSGNNEDGEISAGDILAVSVREGSNEVIKVGGLPGSVPPGSTVQVTNLNTTEVKTTQALSDGSFDPEFTGSTDDIFRVEILENGELVDFIDLGVTTLKSLVDRNLAQLGSVPSTIEINGVFAYVLNGFSDNIQIFDISQHPPLEIRTLVLPPGSDPVAMDFIDDFRGVVANFIGQSVAVVNFLTGQCETLYTRQENAESSPCLDQVNLGTGSFEEPAGVVVSENFAYISNNNLDEFFSPNGNGFITVIDLTDDSSFTLQTTGANADYMTLIDDEIFIVNAGNVLFDFDTSEFSCDEEFQPSIDILNTNSKTITDSIPVPLSPSNPLVCLLNVLTPNPTNQVGYIGMGIVGALLKVNLVEKQLINGADNPIIITDLSGLNSTNDMVVDENGIGYIALFNTDEIATIDTSNDMLNPFPYIAPIPAGLKADNPDSDFFDGVQSLAIREGFSELPSIYGITGISSQLFSLETF